MFEYTTPTCGNGHIAGYGRFEWSVTVLYIFCRDNSQEDIIPENIVTYLPPGNFRR